MKRRGQGMETLAVAFKGAVILAAALLGARWVSLSSPHPTLAPDKIEWPHQKAQPPRPPAAMS